MASGNFCRPGWWVLGCLAIAGLLAVESVAVAEPSIELRPEGARIAVAFQCKGRHCVDEETMRALHARIEGKLTLCGGDIVKPDEEKAPPYFTCKSARECTRKVRDQNADVGVVLRLEGRRARLRGTLGLYVVNGFGEHRKWKLKRSRSVEDLAEDVVKMHFISFLYGNNICGLAGSRSGTVDLMEWYREHQDWMKRCMEFTSRLRKCRPSLYQPIWRPGFHELEAIQVPDNFAKIQVTPE